MYIQYLMLMIQFSHCVSDTSIIHVGLCVLVMSTSFLVFIVASSSSTLLLLFCFLLCPVKEFIFWNAIQKGNVYQQNGVHTSVQRQHIHYVQAARTSLLTFHWKFCKLKNFSCFSPTLFSFDDFKFVEFLSSSQEYFIILSVCLMMLLR